MTTTAQLPLLRYRRPPRLAPPRPWPMRRITGWLGGGYVALACGHNAEETGSLYQGCPWCAERILGSNKAVEAYAARIVESARRRVAS